MRLVLVEGPAKKSTAERVLLTGRTDGNKRVVFPLQPVFKSMSSIEESDRTQLRKCFEETDMILLDHDSSCTTSSDKFKGASARADRAITDIMSSLLARRVAAAADIIASSEGLVGSYVVVRITRANGPTLHAVPIAVSSIAESGSKGYVNL